jgi:hypothetical protein
VFALIQLSTQILHCSQWTEGGLSTRLSREEYSCLRPKGGTAYWRQARRATTLLDCYYTGKDERLVSCRATASNVYMHGIDDISYYPDLQWVWDRGHPK